MNEETCIVDTLASGSKIGIKNSGCLLCDSCQPTRYIAPCNLSSYESKQESPLDSLCYSSFNHASLAGSDIFSTPHTLEPINAQDQGFPGLLSSPPNDCWETSHSQFTSPESLSVALASAQPLFPEDNFSATVQNCHPTLFDTASFHSTSIEGSTGYSYNASANSTGTSISPENPAIPVSPHPFSDLRHQLTENFAVTDQQSNSEAHRPEPPHHGRKPRGPSSKNMEPLSCPECPKAFMRRCELTKHFKTHSRAFKCDIPGCESKGFYRARNARRHISSCHGAFGVDGRSLCEYGDCEFASRGFARRDNCLRHMRLRHDYPSGLGSVV